jgi:hypothetical protein
MRIRVSVAFSLLVLCAAGAVAQKPDLPKFMGRRVTVKEPPLDDDGLYPKGPATVCIEGPPERQCYTAPKDFGREPEVSIVQIEKNTPVLFFKVASGGVSGFSIHFAMLQQVQGDALHDISSLAMF